MALPAKSSSDAVIQTLKWTRQRGFRPVPLRYKSKAAMDEHYVDKNYAPPSDDYWTSQNIGIGVVCGPAHSGPTDIDIDCTEALFFAAKFLPPTAAMFGRKSKPNSHYLYLPETDSVPKRAFVDPVAKATIIEIRGDGGHQTVFPGSVHEDTGEVIEWADAPFPEVPHVNAELLEFAVKKVAIAVMIARHLWLDGQRNEIVKHIAGMLFYIDWPVEQTLNLVEGVMEFTGDDDKTRLKTVALTYRKGERGGKITGSGSLRTLLGDGRVVDKILEWAGNSAASILQDYNERFAVVSLRGKFRIAETSGLERGEAPTLYSREDFLHITETDTLEVDDKKIPKARVWLANPRRRAYKSMDFLPGVEDSSPVLNLWTGWSLDPDEKGSCSAWLDLLYYTICGGDQEAYNWMLNWFANLVREPRAKPLTCPVLIGQQGAGKSLLIGYFGRILGPSYVVVTNEEHVYGRFNRHLASTLLLHSEEALYGGDKKHRGIIKSLITDDYRIFEQKGVDAERVKNYLRLVLTSNESHAAPAEVQDRRFSVFDLADRKIKDPRAVVEEMNNGGPAALFHYLLHDLKYDAPLVRVNLKNEALVKMKQVNLDPIAAWWQETLNSGQLLPDFLGWTTKPEFVDWPQIVSSKALHVAFTLKCRDRGIRYIPEETYFGLQLNRMVGVKLERMQRRFDNPRDDNAPREVKQLQSRQYTITNMPTLKYAREAFENFVGQRLEWSDTPDEEEHKGPKF